MIPMMLKEISWLVSGALEGVPTRDVMVIAAASDNPHSVAPGGLFVVAPDYNTGKCQDVGEAMRRGAVPVSAPRLAPAPTMVVDDVALASTTSPWRYGGVRAATELGERLKEVHTVESSSASACASAPTEDGGPARQGERRAGTAGK